MLNSTVWGNFTEGTSADGGAIRINQGTLTLTSSTVSGNYTTGDNARGGGIAGFPQELVLTRSTIARNNAIRGSGGGISAIENFHRQLPLLRLDHTIVADNEDNGTAADRLADLDATSRRQRQLDR